MTDLRAKVLETDALPTISSIAEQLLSLPLDTEKGERVLAHVASAVRRSVRPADLVFRYGGEEFLVLLIDVDLETALSASQRLRSAVASAPAGLPAVTVSVGVALRDHGEEGDDVVARADAALYAAKRAGRDRIEIAPST